jgi:hypothetical protein
MKWIGVWFLSIPVWLIIGAVSAVRFELCGSPHDEATTKGFGVMMLGLFMQAVVEFGIWCML